MGLDFFKKRDAPALLLYPAIRPYVRACKRCVVVVPKGKLYLQLVLDSITGVVARFGICLRSLPQNKLRGPEAETTQPYLGTTVTGTRDHHLRSLAPVS